METIYHFSTTAFGVEHVNVKPVTSKTTTYNDANGFMYKVRVRTGISEAKIFGSN